MLNFCVGEKSTDAFIKYAEEKMSQDLYKQAEKILEVKEMMCYGMN